MLHIFLLWASFSELACYLGDVIVLAGGPGVRQGKLWGSHHIINKMGLFFWEEGFSHTAWNNNIPFYKYNTYTYIILFMVHFK